MSAFMVVLRAGLYNEIIDIFQNHFTLTLKCVLHKKLNCPIIFSEPFFVAADMLKKYLSTFHCFQ